MATAVFLSGLSCGAGVVAAARCLRTITGMNTAFWHPASRGCAMTQTCPHSPFGEIHNWEKSVAVEDVQVGKEK